MATHINHAVNQGDGNFQIINETDSIIRGSGDYSFGSKRSGTDAGLDNSDSESEKLYGSPSEQSGPKPGKKTRGRVKIEMKFIENKLRRYTTFSKRKTGIMKKAYELSTLTGTQVMLLVASETGHVYTFATRKLQPMITSETGKALIQTCLNSPDGTNSPAPVHSTADQRMNITGYEETDFNYNLEDDRQLSSDDISSVNVTPASKKSASVTVTPNSTVATAPIAQEPAAISASKFLADQTLSLTSLFGTPKTEKPTDITMHLPTSTYLLQGTPQAIPAAVQVDNNGTSTGNRVSDTTPTSVYKTFAETSTPSNAPEYTDLKPIAVTNTTTVTTQMEPQLTNIQNTTLNTSQVPQQQPQQQQQTLQLPAQQNALQSGGITFLPGVQSGGSQGGGTLLYQTAQGMVYATTGQLTDGGFMVGLPQPAQNTDQQSGAAGSTQFITIPVPVSLPTGTPMQLPLVQLPLPQSQSTLPQQQVQLALPSSLFNKDSNQNKQS